MTQNTPAPVIVFSAGETSGERHAAALFSQLKRHRADIVGIGMGGADMAQAGIELRYDSSGIAVIGVVEVLKHYGEIRRALQLMKRLLAEQRPDLLLCVDYKEFNFKLATYAKSIGIKVLFYVSPQVWAWRAGRVKAYGKVIDMMAVIFPFETAYYEAERIPVRYVGHPCVDKVKVQGSKAQAFSQFAFNPNAPLVGLLPGSRVNEIQRLLPPMLAAAQQLQQDFPNCQFVLFKASAISAALLAKHLGQTDLPIKVISEQPYELMQCCSAVMTSSGTATLELALLGVPMVLSYKLSPLTYYLGRLLVNIAFIGLPNIIAGKAIVPELIQSRASPANLAAEVRRLLSDADYAQTMRDELAKVSFQLGTGGCSENMAQLVLELLTEVTQTD